MPGFTPFTSNYDDLSNNQGYQFEFRCEVCGSGYRSQFIRSRLATGATLLEGASNIFGGMFGRASNAAENVQNIADRGARDKALEQACNEIMPLFHRCVRCNNWVDETCFNPQRQLCVRCAPNLAAEMEATRSEVELQQMRQAMQAQKVFSGDTSSRQTECPSCGKPVGSEKFCGNCGTPLGTPKCPQCGNEVAVGARFCGNCGGRIGA